MTDENLAQELSAEDRAYFGEEAVNEALAGETSESVAEAEAAETKNESGSEAKTAEDPQKASQEQAQKTVPLAALHEERERRKELQADLVAQRDRTTRMEERFNQFLTAINQPARQAEPTKTVDEDPLGALRRIDQTIAQQQGQQAAQQQTAQQYQQLDSYVTEHETRFRAENADYDDALAHLRAARAADYTAMGVPAAQAQQLVANDAVAIAMQAARAGRSPAEIAYALAKQRGYAPKAAEAKAAETKAVEVTGEEKMAMLEKGTAAAKSLSGGGGGSSDLSLESLANMDDEDFGKITERQWQKLWGA